MTKQKPLIDRLRRHAKDLRLTEAEAEGPGNLAYDLDLAAEAIGNLIVAMAVAREDLERVAVDGDDFADTIAEMDAATAAFGENARSAKEGT